MNELGEDLLLMAVNSDGTLVLPAKLRFGLAGSELVRLAAAGRVDIARGRIVVRAPAVTGDPLLDDALASMSGGWREPTAKAWVKRVRPGLVERYLARAEAAGTIRADRRKALGFIPVTRWLVIDTGKWLTGRKVIVPTHAVGHPDPARETLSVKLTQQQVEDSPGIGLDPPLSREIEASAYEHYGASPQWEAGYLGGYRAQWGSTPFPSLRRRRPEPESRRCRT